MCMNVRPNTGQKKRKYSNKVQWYSSRYFFIFYKIYLVWNDCIILVIILLNIKLKITF